jgi:hypothetical protein
MTAAPQSNSEAEPKSVGSGVPADTVSEIAARSIGIAARRDGVASDKRAGRASITTGRGAARLLPLDARYLAQDDEQTAPHIR